MIWDGDTAAWWREEVASDPAYGSDVDPLLTELIAADREGLIGDLGCGTGRLSEHGVSIGFDRSLDLARTAAKRMPVCVADVRDLPLGEGALDGAIAVLVLEHLNSDASLFAEAARVVRPGGFLVVIANHPVFTAPGSGPFVDPEDGEVLWRWGRYLATGHSDEPAGSVTIRFHHRPIGHLLTIAAAAGWDLEVAVERPTGSSEDLLMAAQADLPRLLGLRWRRRVQGPAAFG